MSTPDDPPTSREFDPVLVLRGADFDGLSQSVRGRASLTTRLLAWSRAVERRFRSDGHPLDGSLLEGSADEVTALISVVGVRFSRTGAARRRLDGSAERGARTARERRVPSAEEASASLT